MSEPWLSWVALRSSRLQRRLIALALLGSALSAALLAAAAFQTRQVAAFAGAALALGAAFAACRAWRRPDHPPLLRIDAEGRIGVRHGDETAAAQPVFVSRWLVCLRTGPRRVLPVWRDALDDAGYRRLAAASRWGRQRAPEMDGMSDPIA